MVTLTRIYTRGGDSGQTSLGRGERVAKHDPRVEAYGTTDEANSVIEAKRGEQALRIVASQVERLEHEIDAMNAELEPLKSFILPGGSEAAAWLHLARTVARRAERRMTQLAAEQPINPEAIKYINRLSDHLFVLARRLNDNGANDVLWVPGGGR
jgi:cob(I)alamin adenosyltransferase